MKINHISPDELKEKMSQRERFTLLDVREPEEFEICHITGSILVPLSEFMDHIPDFDPHSAYVITCKHGNRSQKAIEILTKNGFDNLLNLDGGIFKWAKTIERTMELY